MSTRFGFNVEKGILNEEIGCVLLCKSVPVLTLDVLQIAEESKTHHLSQNRDISRLYSILSRSR